MKKTGFKKPSLEEIKEKQAQKRLKLLSQPPKARKPRVSLKNTGKRQNFKKSTKGKVLPNWLKAIPESQAHGSGTFQKRLWRLTSDYVRIRDFYLYGCCAATGKRIEHWSQGQAGHLKPYSTCNALFKFDVRNIHLQSASSNKWGNFDTFRDYEKVVRNRGYDFDNFERENNLANGSRLYDADVVEEIKKILILMKELPEKPDYYDRAIELLNLSPDTV